MSFCRLPDDLVADIVGRIGDLGEATRGGGTFRASRRLRAASRATVWRSARVVAGGPPGPGELRASALAGALASGAVAGVAEIEARVEGGHEGGSELIRALDAIAAAGAGRRVRSVALELGRARLYGRRTIEAVGRAMPDVEALAVRTDPACAVDDEGGHAPVPGFARLRSLALRGHGTVTRLAGAFARLESLRAEIGVDYDRPGGDSGDVDWGAIAAIAGLREVAIEPRELIDPSEVESNGGGFENLLLPGGASRSTLERIRGRVPFLVTEESIRALRDAERLRQIERAVLVTGGRSYARLADAPRLEDVGIEIGIDAFRRDGANVAASMAELATEGLRRVRSVGLHVCDRASDELDGALALAILALGRRLRALWWGVIDGRVIGVEVLRALGTTRAALSPGELLAGPRAIASDAWRRALRDAAVAAGGGIAVYVPAALVATARERFAADAGVASGSGSIEVLDMRAYFRAKQLDGGVFERIIQGWYA